MFRPCLVTIPLQIKEKLAERDSYQTTKYDSRKAGTKGHLSESL